MGILRYDESKIVRALDRVAPEFKTAFAAACVERIFPAYQAFSARTGRGNPQVLAMILDEHLSKVFLTACLQCFFMINLH
jgi:uncharacterized protein YjaG (DUF416 family)